MKRSIDVCLTPELLHLYGHKNSIVVVVDIFRATSCMTTALAHGVKEIKPVSKVEECSILAQNGHIGAAERNGEIVEGFNIGNSPFSYMCDEVKGKKVAMTTTNGTVAIENSKDALEIVIGSFLNIGAVENYLRERQEDVLILCAGWKGKVNLEDTMFAGALIERLKNDFEVSHDGSMAAQAIYNIAKDDMGTFLSNSSHAKRLKRLNIQKDIEFCLKQDVFDIVPVLKNGVLVPLEPVVVSSKAS